VLNVTKVFLPPLGEYISKLEGIWARSQLTNNGPLVQELEQRLKAELGVKHLFLVNNGTIALQIAYRALGLVGKVITTPFSYVATVSSAVWEGLEPVFADIDSTTLCIDPEHIKALIEQHRPSAILATQVFGNACNVAAISEIAKRYGVKVIYDAAHAYGARLNGRSLASFGDVSTLSFHATKLFHTAEGGAIVTNDDNCAKRIEYMRNFGHDGPEHFHGLGINAKVSELNAAMGLCVIDYVPALIAQRRVISEYYDHSLAGLDLRMPKWAAGLMRNFAYYPIILRGEKPLLVVRAALNEAQIYPRRYFYPSLHQLPYVQQVEMPVSAEFAACILCLPLHGEMPESDAQRVCAIIRRVLE
jgi:dTDP-4-amino-4,6-dideoxygalactose transaminase